ncbi:hypothetical protein EW146_g2142 [Bondarzewia mesenterica]|uniref:IQ domain-containing calmodulin-binding protein n=1 Tax=Bondarzewia mesenterica TaxID=1095465 RepID=A0A4S4M323_9AGAM|nr:hypothetical protein EW146_g2142 [Bondarzewia mesenterica]
MSRQNDFTGDSKDKEDLAQREAAERSQRIWRDRNHAEGCGNDVKSKFLTPDTRWNDALLSVEMNTSNAAAEEGSNLSRARWRRAGVMTKRLQDGDKMLQDEGIDIPEAMRKQLETQHWLELVDGQVSDSACPSPRSTQRPYAGGTVMGQTVLKYYHKRWVDSDTQDNFFRWLDRGEGKDLSLKECSREQLERERIVYLSAEQRLNYLVQIDSEGKLRWARNDCLVDTSAGHWEDAGRDEGIVSMDEPDISEQRDRQSSPSSSSLSSAAQDAVKHYVGAPKGKSRLTRAHRSHFTIHGMVDQLLRKTIKRNTWIYVADKNFNLFVGIKVPGKFQHSSFLAGGLVTSAGLISVKDGIIHTLSPLSGHYRTSIDHFRSFLDVLERRGVNMDKVETSKAESALWLIEHLAKFKKRQSVIFSKGKKKVADTVKESEELGKAISSGNSKLDILEGRKKKNIEEDLGKKGAEQEGMARREKSQVEK